MGQRTHPLSPSAIDLLTIIRFVYPDISFNISCTSFADVDPISGVKLENLVRRMHRQVISSQIFCRRGGTVKSGSGSISVKRAVLGTVTDRQKYRDM